MKITIEFEPNERNDVINYLTSTVAQSMPAPSLPAPPAATLPAEVLDTAQGVTEEVAPDVDADGLPWDERIHSSSKKLTAKGVWTRRRGVTDEEFDAVAAEYRGEGESAQVVPSFLKTEVPVPPAPPAADVSVPVPPAPSEESTVDYSTIEKFVTAQVSTDPIAAVGKLGPVLKRYGFTSITEAAGLDASALAQLHEALQEAFNDDAAA